MTSWAYEFSSPKSLYAMETILNQAGPWPWRVRDCAWYPDYLQCRPGEGVRICIYEVNPPGGPLYRALVEVGQKSNAQGASLETAFRDLLAKVSAENISEIEAAEWPFD